MLFSILFKVFSFVFIGLALFMVMQFLSFVFMLISLLFVVLTFLCSRFLFNHHRKISEGIDGKSKLIELDLEDKG